jgi:hypothetical protein
MAEALRRRIDRLAGRLADGGEGERGRVAEYDPAAGPPPPPEGFNGVVIYLPRTRDEAAAAREARGAGSRVCESGWSGWRPAWAAPAGAAGWSR